MEIKKVLLNIVYFFIFAIMVIGILFLVNYKAPEKILTASIVQPEPAEPVFDPASLAWEQVSEIVPWESRDSEAVLVYKDKLWMMGGLDANGLVARPGLVQYEKAKYFSDVWNSDDGKTWTQIAKTSVWGDRRSIQVVEFEGKMWLMGGWGPKVGMPNDIWSSEDGITWIKEVQSASWPAREGHQLIVFQDKLWLMGGVSYVDHKLYNDVWSSEDGVKWENVTDHAGWSPRWDHASAVYNNKIWVTGGMQFGDKILNDVWYSENGRDWILATASAQWASRQGHGLVEYKNKLWIVSRLDNAQQGGINDVWYTTDGVDWEKTAEDPKWTGREDVCVNVFQDKIWIIGGMDKNWQWMNDVWFSTYK